MPYLPQACGRIYAPGTPWKTTRLWQHRRSRGGRRLRQRGRGRGEGRARVYTPWRLWASRPPVDFNPPNGISYDDRRGDEEETERPNANGDDEEDEDEEVPPAPVVPNDGLGLSVAVTVSPTGGGDRDNLPPLTPGPETSPAPEPSGSGSLLGRGSSTRSRTPSSATSITERVKKTDRRPRRYVLFEVTENSQLFQYDA